MSGATSTSSVGASTPSAPTVPPAAIPAPASTASRTHATTRSRFWRGDELGHLGRLILRVADHQRIDQRRQVVGEFGGDVAVDVHPLGGNARLAGVAEKPASRILSAARLQSPSAAITTGALFPSSSPTRLRGAAARIPQPTSGEPVNDSSATSSCRTSAAPTCDPGPVTICSIQVGSPAANSRPAKAMDENGPVRWVSAPPDSRPPPPGRPCAPPDSTEVERGDRADDTDRHRYGPGTLPSAPGAASRGIISPTSRRASSAENRRVPAARSASDWVVICFAFASVRDDPGERLRGCRHSRAPLVFRMSARCHGRSGPALRCRRAYVTACATSGAPRLGTRPSGARRRETGFPPSARRRGPRRELVSPPPHP